MPRRPITVEDLWSLPRVGTPVPAPDGKRAVVPVTTYSMQTNEAATRLWLVAPDAEPRALTGAETRSGAPAISPDGKRIAFVRKPGGAKGDGKGKPGPAHPDQPQLYVMPLDGGEPERVTDLPLGVIDPRWFPDGRRIAFLTTVFADSPTPEGTAKLQREREDEPVKARVTEDRLYRYWDRWLTDGKVQHIFMVDLATRAQMDLTPDSRRWFDLQDPSNQYRIAPDGREIAFAADRSAPPHDPPIWSLFTVKVPARLGGKAPRARCLTARHEGHAGIGAYSPDGRWLVYGIQRDLEFYADRVRLVAYDRKSGMHTPLTEGWDRSASGWTFAQDGHTVYFTAEDDARTALYALDLRSARKKGPRRLVRGGTFGAPQIAGGKIFATLDGLSSPPEVYTCDLHGNGLKRLSHFTAPGMKELELGAVVDDRFPGANGDSVQMYLVHPPGVKKPRRLPLVHMIHGGPHGTFGDNWHWRWNPHVFAAPGYVTALVNFHGSTSWGQDFAQCIQGRWGDQPYADLMAATDRLIQRGIADPKRMAATGGSYGGYMAAWIASQTDRFACLINHAGVCDLQLQWAADHPFGWTRAFGGTAWKDQPALDRYSPMRHAKGFRSPMLVLHGEQDYRVPYDHGLQIYNVYKAMKRQARLVCYPDENHWVLKPRNSRHWYGEVLAWLGRWIGKGRGKRQQ